jgi:hypothetical protein
VRGEPTSFWGKLGMAEDGSRQWHPLSHHCADVAAVAETLSICRFGIAGRRASPGVI